MHAPVRWDIPLLLLIAGLFWAGVMFLVLACFHTMRKVKMKLSTAPVPANSVWRKK